MRVRSTILASLLLVVAAASTIGCKENEAATKACKGANGSSKECAACCKEKGANGHKFVNGDCGCLGG